MRRRFLVSAFPVGLLLLAAAPFEGAIAQIRSTTTGGLWQETSTWEGGTVPGAGDDVVIASGATVQAVTFRHRCANLIVEEGATLHGGFEFAVLGDLTNRGQLEPNFMTVVGSVTNEGVISPSAATIIYVYGDIVNRGQWSGQVHLAGDQGRTVDLRGADAAVSASRNLYYIDLIPPRVLLVGENFVPAMFMPTRGGDFFVLGPGALLHIDDSRDAGLFEHGNWFLNYGRLNATYRRDTGGEIAASHGAEFTFGGDTRPEWLTVTAHGHQSPEDFPNALRSWWEVEAQPGWTSPFEYAQLEFAKDELPPTYSADSELTLFYSPGAGEPWAPLEVESIAPRTTMNPLGAEYLIVEVQGALPSNGRYAIATGSPLSLQGRHGVTAQIIGRPAIRVGGPEQEYLIQYTNTGSTPVYRGLLSLTTEGGVYIERIVTSSRDGQGGVEMGKDAFSMDDDSTTAMLVTPVLAPGESRTFSVFLKAVPEVDEPAGKLVPLVLPAVAGAVVVGIGKGYLIDLAAATLEEQLADPCGRMGDFSDKMNNAFDAADAKWNPFGNSESSWLAVADNGAAAMAEDGLLKQGLGKANALNDLKTFADAVTKGFDRYESSYNRSVFQPLDCDGPTPPAFPPGLRFPFPLNPVSSFDPNAKLGPAGIGDRGFIPSAGTFTYRILFENLAEATAPAYRIVIVDTLSDAFDAMSVQRVRESHSGFNFTRTDNILRWEVVGIELPPNVNPPEGEGFVEFTVQARPGLESGAVLSNRAEITFDLNEPILTNEHVNTLDFMPPVTTMNPLPAESIGDSLTVSWAIDDQDGSGGASTAVFVSRDGAPFTQAGVTAQTSMNVPVIPGSTYSFFALSADQAGNVEEVPPEAVSTAVVVGTESADVPLRFALHGAYPNPFNPSTTITFDLARAGRVSLRLYNVLGQRLEVIELGEMSSGRYSRVVDLSRYASGVYFYELRVTGPEGLLYRAIDNAILVR